MDWTDVLLLGLISLVLYLALYGCYRLGKRKERIELTMALIAQTKDTYYDGYDAGKLTCK